MMLSFPFAEPWMWVAAAAALAIAELIAPGIFLIWIGAAALLTGIVALLVPLPLAAQLLIFAVAAGGAILFARGLIRRNPIVSSDPLLNDRTARMVGSIVTAVEATSALGGRVKAGDSIWPARGDEAKPGEQLRVIGAEGQVLLVERA